MSRYPRNSDKLAQCDVHFWFLPGVLELLFCILLGMQGSAAFLLDCPLPPCPVSTFSVEVVVTVRPPLPNQTLYLRPLEKKTGREVVEQSPAQNHWFLINSRQATKKMV